MRRIVLRCFLLVGFTTSILATGCKKNEPAPQAAKMQFSKLSVDDEARLELLRSEIQSEARKRYEIRALTRTAEDLAVIQRLIDDKVYGKLDFLHQQAFGAVLGDVLATDLELHWEVVTDQYGTDLVLRYKTNEIIVAPLTMISKRIEKGEQIDVVQLYAGVKEYLNKMIASGDYR